MGDVLGVADVAFVGEKLFALAAGGGCSHGTTSVPAGIATVGKSGAWSIIADLSAWQAAHPVAHPNAGDFEPDGSWYGMITSQGSLVAVEPNHGEVVRVNPRSGAITRLADISATQGHIVPTVVAERRGALYLSSLGTFPGTPGAEKILRLSPTGKVSEVATGFTAVLGLDFDSHGRLYVLEMGEVGGFPSPGAGRVVRLDKKGNRVVIVEGLFLPTGIRIGPDKQLYISNKGFGPPQPGEVLRVDLRPKGDGDDSDDMESGRD
jgi:sugar lactone lactonase YvrE